MTADHDDCYGDYNCKSFLKYIGDGVHNIRTYGGNRKEVYTIKREKGTYDVLQLKWVNFFTADEMPSCSNNYVKVELGLV